MRVATSNIEVAFKIVGLYSPVGFKNEGFLGNVENDFRVEAIEAMKTFIAEDYPVEFAG